MSQKSKYTLIGILVVLILAAAYWGFNFLKANDIFNKQNNYFIVYERIDGLNVSSPVTINGYKVGQVTDIQLTQNKKIELLITITTSSEYQIPVSSVARIYSMDLMGTKGIEIEFSESNQFHADNDTLIGTMEQSLKDQVNMQMLPIKNQAEELMKEMESAIAVVKYIFNEETRQNLHNSFASIKKTVEYLENSSQNLDSIMSGQKTRIARILEYSERITHNLSDNSEAITNLIQNLSDVSDSLAKADIVQTINDANKAVAKISEITDKINRGEGSLGLLINNDSLYNELQSASVNLDRLLYDMRLNPQRYVNVKLINFGRDIQVVDESMLNDRDRKKLEKKRQRIEEQNQKSDR
jgi:phospholipid/cholesterol/gamma-HCH transport system substrate-binding protein